ncbi:unnamed protein product, partial [Timema podura]|nr:unnamed protein product [Timema podura]
RYAKEGADKTRGRDITGYLSMMLGLPEIEIRQGFHRHPYWCHIPLHSVKDTLHYLLELGYTREQVWSNVHLLVYPRLQTVSGGLVVLESELSASQRLAMCLYFIEKEFHFTGDGVWTDQATPSLSNEVSSIEASQ